MTVHKLIDNNYVSEKVDIEKFKEESEDLILYKFTIPNISVGDVIEMKYLISSPNVTILPRFFFQHEVPVDSAQYTIDVPGYFALSPNLKGYLDLKVTNEKLPFSPHFEIRYMIKAKDVKPFKNPKYIMDIDDYRSSIKYEMASYQLPRQSKTDLSNSWKDVADHFWDLWKMDKAIKYSYKKLGITENFESEADTLKKVKLIVDFVHDNYTWNKEYMSEIPNLKKLVKNKSGNILDLNFIIINILRKHGIDASPLLTRHRSYGYINDKFPSRGNFNNMLTFVKIGKGYVLIDPSDKNLDIGQISLRARNFSGLLMNVKSEAEFMYYNTNNIDKKLIQARFTINEDKTIDVLKKEKLSSTAKEKYFRNKKDYIPKSSELVKPVENNRNESIKLEYNYKIDEPLMQLEDKLLIPSCLECPFELLSLDEEERDYPIIVPSKAKQSYIYQINIPEGWKLESKPEDAKIKNHNKMIEMDYSLKESKDKLIVSILYEIRKEVFEPKEYRILRNTINKMKEKLEETIVLVKAE